MGSPATLGRTVHAVGAPGPRMAHVVAVSDDGARILLRILALDGPESDDTVWVDNAPGSPGPGLRWGWTWPPRSP